VVIYELIGPVSAKIALMKSGESKPREAEPGMLLDME
jgi:hypothetical protein